MGSGKRVGLDWTGLDWTPGVTVSHSVIRWWSLRMYVCVCVCVCICKGGGVVAEVRERCMCMGGV